ncbi:hypothetical protein M5689_016639 [Euphorbia peplus]|nr:hypothetical protein M5689_016639 [Euphorbia peplus]
MAKYSKISFTLAFLITLLLAYGITSTESRLIPVEMWRAGTEEGAGNIYLRRSLFTDVDGEKDDFRPTNPGHSPGAGHSSGPSSNTAN